MADNHRGIPEENKERERRTQNIKCGDARKEAIPDDIHPSHTQSVSCLKQGHKTNTGRNDQRDPRFAHLQHGTGRRRELRHRRHGRVLREVHNKIPVQRLIVSVHEGDTRHIQRQGEVPGKLLTTSDMTVTAAEVPVLVEMNVFDVNAIRRVGQLVVGGLRNQVDPVDSGGIAGRIERGLRGGGGGAQADRAIGWNADRVRLSQLKQGGAEENEKTVAHRVDDLRLF